MLWPLFVIRALLGLSLAAYAAYSLIAVWAAEKWRRAKRPISPEWTPGISLLKPVRGIDAEAYENFASFCRQDYPADRFQLLFGTLDPDDPALDLVRRLQREFPHCDIGIVTASPNAKRGTNLKVCNLVSLLPHARYDLIVLCDSDMRVEPDYLRRIAAPFEAPQSGALEASKLEKNRPVGLVTCPYRGGRVQSLAAVLEALGIGMDFIPSTMVSRALEGVAFALGSTIVIPRPVLEQIGGFEPLLDELADDFRLGNAVFKAGYEVVLSDYVIEDVLGHERFGAMWSRRLRWARTLRVCRPAGYAGSFVTYGTALSLFFLLAMGGTSAGWAVAAAMLVFRCAVALVITLRCTKDPNVLRFLPLLPLSDLLNFTLFVVSFCGSTIVWRGDRFRLLPGGRLERL